VDGSGASEALWAGGYLYTGDIAHITPDGYIRVTDRMKDVIKSGGEWISSLEIEELIARSIPA
jgi:fatty-acyl-CoA synthase